MELEPIWTPYFQPMTMSFYIKKKIFMSISSVIYRINYRDVHITILFSIVANDTQTEGTSRGYIDYACIQFMCIPHLLLKQIWLITKVPQNIVQRKWKYLIFNFIFLIISKNDLCEIFIYVFWSMTKYDFSFLYKDIKIWWNL